MDKIQTFKVSDIQKYSEMSKRLAAAEKRQHVANPGLLTRYTATGEARKNAALKTQIEKLAVQVASLEAHLQAQEPPLDAHARPSIDELVASLQALTDVAMTSAQPTQLTTSREYGSGPRPKTAPYRAKTDSASMVSWSADAFGKSKTPGWYHMARKGLYKQRAEAAASDPAGCYVSHSKYADEAVRIASTGRLAF